MALQRYFIVTTGRTGSSVLSAILAASGANFAMPEIAGWDATSCAMEHPDFARATMLLAKARELSESKPADPYRHLVWSLHRHEAKRLLRRALDEAVYVKAANADLALQMSIGLGYAPRVIVSYRRPEAQIASQFIHSTYRSVDSLLARYVRVMRNALGAVRILGGCVVSFDELQDPNAGEWAEALAAVTGLAAETLLERRAALIRPAPPDLPATCLSREAERLWFAAEDLRGQVFGLTRPAARVVQAFPPRAQLGP